MLSVIFFSNQKITRDELHRLFLIVLGPFLGVCSIAAFATYTTENIKFGTESMKLTSGGFGPNQVSGTLGIGMVLAFFYLMDSGGSKSIRLLILGVGVLFAMQSALTFSRTGIFSAALTIITTALFLIQNSRLRTRLIIFGIILVLVGKFLVFPFLDRFTGGALSVRFKEKGMTGRETIMQDELNIWRRNFMLGVGPGQAMYHHEGHYYGIATHSEITRTLAEHGVLGFVAVVLLPVMGGIYFVKARSKANKALVTACVMWSLLFVFSNAMRIAAPSFVFGLAAVTIWPDVRVLVPYRNRNEARKDL